jgi:hypothetical protein
LDYQVIKDLGGPIATVIASAAAAFVAYRLGKSQIAVAKMQADIAQRNWRTANEKVVLELFEGGSPFTMVSVTSSGKSVEVETRRMIYFFAS